MRFNPGSYLALQGEGHDLPRLINIDLHYWLIQCGHGGFSVPSSHVTEW
jgi:hypothetical protein